MKNVSIAVLFLLLSILTYHWISVKIMRDKQLLNVTVSSSGKIGSSGYPDYILPLGTILYDDTDDLNVRAIVYFDLDENLDFVMQDSKIDKKPAELDRLMVSNLSDIEGWLKRIKLNKQEIKAIIDDYPYTSKEEKKEWYRKYEIE